MQLRPKAIAVFCVAALIAGTADAMVQRCPPNSHAEALAIPGNLRTAQCFCNPGFVPSGGLCVPIRHPEDQPPRTQPGRVLVAPMPFR
jgi:hypothetical protein